jgi:hypothetical protein
MKVSIGSPHYERVPPPLNGGRDSWFVRTQSVFVVSL